MINEDKNSNVDLENCASYDLNNISSIPDICGIYCFKNKINGKCYIGKSIHIRCRIRDHFRQKDHLIFHRALEKYGKENFLFYIIEELERDNNTLSKREIYWIEQFDSFNSGYNMTKGGDGLFGTVCSEKNRQLMGDRQKKKTIGYNYIERYYIECDSRTQMSEVLKSKGFNISDQNVYDALLSKGSSHGFIFGNTIADIQWILNNRSLPHPRTIYLYDTRTNKYCGKFTNSSEVTLFIKNYGITISDTHVISALKQKNKLVKGFIIAETLHDLIERVQNYKSSIFAYNMITGELSEYKNATVAHNEMIPKCTTSDITNCLNNKQKQIHRVTFGYSAKDAIEKAAALLRDEVIRGINQIEKLYGI